MTPTKTLPLHDHPFVRAEAERRTRRWHASLADQPRGDGYAAWLLEGRSQQERWIAAEIRRLCDLQNEDTRSFWREWLGIRNGLGILGGIVFTCTSRSGAKVRDWIVSNHDGSDRAVLRKSKITDFDDALIAAVQAELVTWSKEQASTRATDETPC